MIKCPQNYEINVIIIRILWINMQNVMKNIEKYNRLVGDMAILSEFRRVFIAFCR